MGRAALFQRLRRRLVGWAVIGNTLGATIGLVYLLIVFPAEDEPGRHVDETTNVLVLVAVLGVTTVIGNLAGLRLIAPLRAWAMSDQPVTEALRKAVVQLPSRIVVITGCLWAGGALVFGLINLDVGVQFATEVTTTVALAGMTTCLAAYLVSERMLRPAFALMFESRPPPEAGTLGIAPRILLTWALCAALPLIGVGLIPVGRAPTEGQAIAATWFVVGIGIVAGLLFMTLAMRAVADPVRDVRRGMDAVASGDLDVEVEVDDGSEVGRLQAGFNAMVAGLREREELRDLFGRQVGEDVARVALERGIDLEGEARPVAALFVDVIDSTGLAVREQPEEVVARLNAFFAHVVAVADAHGGLVNKFAGDAALLVFGVPIEQEDHPARALAAARELRERLVAAGALDAAIGVSWGIAVAGHVGAESRFEYTVLGDPVNEASRLSVLAKERPGRVLASGSALDAAGPEEAARWTCEGEIGAARPRRPNCPRGADPDLTPSTYGQGDQDHGCAR